VNHDQVQVRALAPGDLQDLAAFACSAGTPWEELVQQQLRGPLPRRYLAAPPRFDGRMLIARGPDGRLLVVGAHHIEPTLVPVVGYTEVIAVAQHARGTLIGLPDTEQVSLGHFMLLTIFQQMRLLGRHRRTFARIDRRNTASLALCDRAGLSDEHPDPHHPGLVQRWGELPQ